MPRMLVLPVILALALGGCAVWQGSPKQGVGTLAGAAAGGLVGAQFGSGTGALAATAAGVVLGALVGGSIGRSLDHADRLAMQQATHVSLETARTGEAVQWRNPDTGHYGTVTPTRTTERDGTFCREFQQAIAIGGRTEEGVGTACRQPDGSWRILR
jgi:surface antigen